MPDVGLPSSAAPGLTHTATRQWQSFEIRMRHRRAERCRLRAEIAIEAGVLEDAREALDEARRLQPDLPGLALAEERLAVAQFALNDVPADSPRGGRRLTAAVAMALAIGAGSWVIVGNQDGTPGAARSGATAEPAPAVSIPQVIAPAPAAPNQLLEGTDRAIESGSRETDPAPKPAPKEPVTTTNPTIVLPAPERPGASRGVNPSPLPVLQVSASPAGPTVPAPPPAAPLPMDGSSLGVAASLPAPVPAVAPGPEMQVQDALSRYEAAYSSLNAAAARAVWPSVDAAALARAFDDLESQRISLGSCSIAVASDARSARATCAGTATWTPKVGGGTTTGPRTWSFDLAHTGSEWHIVSATTR